MTEIIKIKKVGLLNDISIDDVKPITILIGDNDKNIIMKIMCMFREMCTTMNIRIFLKQYCNIKKLPIKLNIKDYFHKYDLFDYINNDTYFYYSNNIYQIEYKNKKCNIIINDNIITNDDITFGKVSYLSDKRNMIADIMYHQIVLRNDTSFYIKELFNDYLNVSDAIDTLKMPFNNMQFLKKKTVRGTMAYVSPIGNFNNIVSLNNANPGIMQSTIIGLFAEYFSKHYDLIKNINEVIFENLANTDLLKEFNCSINVSDIPNKYVNLFIESPENNLYPNNQIKLIDYIIDKCYISNKKQHNINLMMTTDSPYILNYFNLLLKRKNGIYINDDIIGAYCVKTDNIIDLNVKNSKNKLFDTTLLSDTINCIYDEYEQLK